jgi:hypothetical protein
MMPFQTALLAFQTALLAACVFVQLSKQTFSLTSAVIKLPLLPNGNDGCNNIDTIVVNNIYSGFVKSYKIWILCKECLLNQNNNTSYLSKSLLSHHLSNIRSNGLLDIFNIRQYY